MPELFAFERYLSKQDLPEARYSFACLKARFEETLNLMQKEIPSKEESSPESLPQDSLKAEDLAAPFLRAYNRGDFSGRKCIEALTHLSPLLRELKKKDPEKERKNQRYLKWQKYQKAKDLLESVNKVHGKDFPYRGLIMSAIASSETLLDPHEKKDAEKEPFVDCSFVRKAGLAYIGGEISMDEMKTVHESFCTKTPLHFKLRDKVLAYRKKRKTHNERN